MKEKKNFFERTKMFVKEHKTKIIIAGVTITVGGVLIAVNWDWIMGKDIPALISKSKTKDIVDPFLPEEIPNIADVMPTKCKLIDYRMFIRNLPEGQHPSVEKIASAAENDIKLCKNQTWVVPHTKQICA